MDAAVNLVLINQYFPPDEAPTGLMLEAVAERLVEQGHRVTVLCSVAGGYAGAGPGEAERDGARNSAEPGAGVRLLRVGATSFGRASFLGKLVDYASFYLGVGWQLLRLDPKPDRIVALTTPPYLAVLARIGSKLRGGDHAHWVMDLYPDVMVAHGMLKEGGLPARLLGALTRFGFGGSRCAGVVTLGPDMAQRVSKYLPPGIRAQVVPLWASDRQATAPLSETELAVRAQALRRERGWQGLVLMYSGNMGLGHRFSEFLGWAASSTSGQMAFFGGGKRRREVESFIESHPQAAVELHEYVPRDQLSAHLLSADVHLAALEPCWDGTMVPSKLQGIFAAGRSVIFVGSRSSSIGSWIEESGGGWVVAPNDRKALDQAIQQASDPSQRAKRGAAAMAFAQQNFDRRKNTERVAEELKKKLKC